MVATSDNTIRSHVQSFIVLQETVSKLSMLRRSSVGSLAIVCALFQKFALMKFAIMKFAITKFAIMKVAIMKFAIMKFASMKAISMPAQRGLLQRG